MQLKETDKIINNIKSKVENYLYKNRLSPTLDTTYIPEGIQFKAAYPALWLDIGHKDNRPICNNNDKFISLNTLGQLPCGPVQITSDNKVFDGQHTTWWVRSKCGKIKYIIVEFNRSLKLEHIPVIQNGKKWKFDDHINYSNPNKDMLYCYNTAKKLNMPTGTYANLVSQNTTAKTAILWSMAKFSMDSKRKRTLQMAEDWVIRACKYISGNLNYNYIKTTPIKISIFKRLVAKYPMNKDSILKAIDNALKLSIERNDLLVRKATVEYCLNQEQFKESHGLIEHLAKKA